MLSNRQINILKYLYSNNLISENELRKYFNVGIDDKAINTLSKNRLIHIDSSKLYQPKLIHITEDGIAHIEHLLNLAADKRSKNIHEWINTVIAGLALVVAIISLIVSITK